MLKITFKIFFKKLKYSCESYYQWFFGEIDLLYITITYKFENKFLAINFQQTLGKDPDKCHSLMAALKLTVSRQANVNHRNMKNKLATFLILLSVITVSCEQINDLLTFEIKDSTEFTIPSFTVVSSPISIPVPPIESSSSQAFENSNTNASLVKDVLLKELNLEILDPEAKSFGFLESIAIYIAAEDVDEVLLASKYDIPEDVGSTIMLDTSGEKLDEYIKRGNYTLRTVVKVKEVPGEDVTVNAEMVFKVTADPL